MASKVVGEGSRELLETSTREFESDPGDMRRRRVRNGMKAQEHKTAGGVMRGLQCVCTL